MSALLSRWPVLEEHEVDADDLDANGVVRDETVARWVAAARAAHLAQCTRLRELLEHSGWELRDEAARIPPGRDLGRPTGVVVTAGVTEVRSTSFVMAIRLRPGGGDRDMAVNARCVVQMVDPATGAAQPIGTDIRDEFIALEHAARHFN